MYKYRDYNYKIQKRRFSREESYARKWWAQKRDNKSRLIYRVRILCVFVCHEYVKWVKMCDSCRTSLLIVTLPTIIVVTPNNLQKSSSSSSNSSSSSTSSSLSKNSNEQCGTCVNVFSFSSS